MTQKKPKITVTESNREFVIPTLEKFGGVNTFELNGSIISEGDILYINLIGSHLTRDRSGATNKSMFYEVDPKDYVGVKGKSKIHQKLIDTSEKSDWSENVLYDQNQHLKSELDQLKSENEILKNKCELLKEDLECVNMWLDENGYPKTSELGEAYSIVGRIKNNKLQAENEKLREFASLLLKAYKSCFMVFPFSALDVVIDDQAKQLLNK